MKQILIIAAIIGVLWYLTRKQKTAALPAPAPAAPVGAVGTQTDVLGNTIPAAVYTSPAANAGGSTVGFNPGTNFSNASS